MAPKKISQNTLQFREILWNLTFGPPKKLHNAPYHPKKENFLVPPLHKGFTFFSYTYWQMKAIAEFHQLIKSENITIQRLLPSGSLFGET